MSFKLDATSNVALKIFSNSSVFLFFHLHIKIKELHSKAALGTTYLNNGHSTKQLSFNTERGQTSWPGSYTARTPLDSAGLGSPPRMPPVPPLMYMLLENLKRSRLGCTGGVNAPLDIRAVWKVNVASQDALVVLSCLLAIGDYILRQILNSYITPSTKREWPGQRCQDTTRHVRQERFNVSTHKPLNAKIKLEATSCNIFLSVWKRPFSTRAIRLMCILELKLE
jgi:hypothetical protein